MPTVKDILHNGGVSGIGINGYYRYTTDPRKPRKALSPCPFNPSEAYNEPTHRCSEFLTGVITRRPSKKDGTPREPVAFRLSASSLNKSSLPFALHLQYRPLSTGLFPLPSPPQRVLPVPKPKKGVKPVSKFDIIEPMEAGLGLTGVNSLDVWTYDGKLISHLPHILPQIPRKGIGETFIDFPSKGKDVFPLFDGVFITATPKQSPSVLTTFISDILPALGLVRENVSEADGFRRISTL